MTDDLATVVRQVLGKKAGMASETLSEDASLSKDLGLDSMALVDAIFELEERFGIAIPFDAGGAEGADLEELTIGGLIARLSGLLTDRG